MLTRKGDAKKLLAGFAKIEADLNRRHQNLIRAMFTDLVVKSPQWSGTLASQWTVSSKGRISGRRTAIKLKSKDYRSQIAYAAGEDPAVSSTLLRESSQIDRVTYDMVVTFSNRTPYAADVEQAMEQDGQMPDGGKLRPENMIADYGGVGMLGYIDLKYRVTGGAKGVLAHGSRK